METVTRPESPAAIEAQKEDLDAQLGSVFGSQYRIEERMGAGGMGAVYRGTQLSMDRPVAIKVIAPNVLQTVVDAAIQIHGGQGMADRELTMLLGVARSLRIADGPDEVHDRAIARIEFGKYGGVPRPGELSSGDLGASR